MKINDIIYIHIPKTGGFSMCQSLQNVGYTNWNHTNWNDHYTAKEIKTSIGDENFKNKFLYTIIRNPMDRIISGYKFMKYGSEVAPVMGSPQYKEYRNLNFEEFIDKLYNNFKLKGEVLLDLNKSFYSLPNKLVMGQHNFIYDNETKLVNHIGRLNKLNELLDKIFDITKVRIPLPQIMNVSKSGGEDINMTDEFINKISEMCQKDIDLFGF